MIFVSAIGKRLTLPLCKYPHGIHSMKNITLNKIFIYFTFSSVVTLADRTSADIKIVNSGAYAIYEICADSFDHTSCRDVALPVGQSYTIPSKDIPQCGTRIGVELFCAGFLVLPIPMRGITTNYIQDGEQIKLGGVCLQFVNGSSINVMPKSSTPMEWQQPLYKMNLSYPWISPWEI